MSGPAREGWDAEMRRLAPEILRDPVAYAVMTMALMVFGEYERYLAGVEERPPSEGTVRRQFAEGFTETETRVIPRGVVQVTSYYTPVKADTGEGPKVVGWHCYSREARLDGGLILSPPRAQALADEAGIPTSEPTTWESDDHG